MSIENISNSSSSDEVQAANETADKKPKGTPLAMDTNATIGNISQFQREHPEVYKKMLEAWATQINSESRQHQENLKKIMREERQRR